MYLPPAFREDDLPAIHATMRAARFANLVTATPEGLVATPPPLLLDAGEGPYGTLYGHVSRGNSHWKLPASGDALALFTGPNAYVTPSWYPTKQATGSVVPTWNYVAVHAYGPVEFFEDADRLLDVVTRLTNLHESGRAEPWAVTDAPEAFIRAQLRGIVGLRLPITRLEGKRKLSQNRNAEDRAGVIAGLNESADRADHDVAALMRP
jgi:transcriptional regulator